MKNFECVENNSDIGLAIFRELTACRPYCVKHNQHAKYANAKGLGHALQENFENRYPEIEFGPFQGQVN